MASENLSHDPDDGSQDGTSGDGAPADPSFEAREERLAHLLRKARMLPDVPGVYLMKDPSGQVLYVGKASVLPNRVSSYFIPSADLGPRKQPMLDVVEDFDFIADLDVFVFEFGRRDDAF